MTCHWLPNNQPFTEEASESTRPGLATAVNWLTAKDLKANGCSIGVLGNEVLL